MLNNLQLQNRASNPSFWHHNHILKSLMLQQSSLQGQGSSKEAQTAAIVLGLLAVPIVAWSEVTLKTTGDRLLPPKLEITLPLIIKLTKDQHPNLAVKKLMLVSDVKPSRYMICKR